MRNKKVVFDLDGVLADFESKFCNKFGWDRREEYSLERRYPSYKDDIDEFVNSPSTYSCLDTVSIGIEIINFLYFKNWDISIVSYRPDDSFGVTFSWLKNNKIPFISLSCERKRDKIDRIKNISPIFVVEDSGKVADELKNISIPVILIAQPWNRNFSGNHPRIATFSQFLSQFYKILGKNDNNFKA